jgi:hypothetical protein
MAKEIDILEAASKSDLPLIELVRRAKEKGFLRDHMIYEDDLKTIVEESRESSLVSMGEFASKLGVSEREAWTIMERSGFINNYHYPVNGHAQGIEEQHIKKFFDSCCLAEDDLENGLIDYINQGDLRNVNYGDKKLYFRGDISDYIIKNKSRFSDHFLKFSDASKLLGDYTYIDINNAILLLNRKRRKEGSFGKSFSAECEAPFGKSKVLKRLNAEEFRLIRDYFDNCTRKPRRKK